MSFEFPKDFLWGAATAAFQVEGHLKDDGAGDTNWLAFCRKPGAVANDDIPLIGSSQYTCYREDVKLMKSLGVKAYRFSIAWSRLFPQGRGTFNAAGLDYYNRLIDELLANGIEPWVTMFHWDLPLALEERGGWRNKDTAKAFADYAGVAARAISDRVNHFFTVNEIICFTSNGYERGIFAPGLKLGRREVNQTIHNGCLAHGLAMQSIRANAAGPIQLGLVDNPINCTPVYESEENIAAARKAFRLMNARILTVIREGKYPDEYVAEQGADMPEYTDDELKAIGTPMDFLGLNVYTPEYIRADASSRHGYAVVPKAASHPAMNVDWLRYGPESIYWTARFVKELWGEKSIYITENGCPSADRLAADGEVYDTDRVVYLREYLRNVSRAVEDGIPLKGYFVWSLLDNFEWADGFQKRFGIVYVNYSTLERTPKLSAKFYRDTIAANHVL